MYQENYNQQEQMEDTDLTTGMSKMAKPTSTKDMLYVLLFVAHGMTQTKMHSLMEYNARYMKASSLIMLHSLL